MGNAFCDLNQPTINQTENKHTKWCKQVAIYAENTLARICITRKCITKQLQKITDKHEWTEVIIISPHYSIDEDEYISIRCDTIEEVTILLNKTLETLKSFPNDIIIHFGEGGGGIRKKSKNEPLYLKEGRPRLIRYTDNFHNFRGIMREGTYFTWEYCFNHMRKIEGRRYICVIDLKDMQYWIDYLKMSTVEREKYDHSDKDLFEATQKELDCMIFLIYSTYINELKQLLYISTFHFPLVLAWKYDQFTYVHFIGADITIRSIILLFMFVTWGLDPDSNSIFKWFLLGHKLYDPRLLLIIESFLEAI